MQEIAIKGYRSSNADEELEEKGTTQLALKIFSKLGLRSNNLWSEVNYDDVPTRLEALEQTLYELEARCDILTKL